MIWLLLLLPTALADPMISGVLYDPDGADSGYEWIELYNPTNTSILLQNYTIEMGNGANQDDWTPKVSNVSAIIPPQKYFLIGEQDVLADYNTKLSLQNGPDAIRLLQNQTVIQLLGWGEHEFDYCQGVCAEDVSGEALINTELILTKNNANDYTPSSREPRDLYYAQGFDTNANVTVKWEVYNKPPVLESYQILSQDRSNEAGYQVFAGDNITLLFEGYDDSKQFFISLVLLLQGEQIQSSFLSYNQTVTIPLNTTLPATDYQLVLTLFDEEYESESLYLPFTLLEIVGMQVSDYYLTLQPYNFTHYATNFTITNVGNTVLDAYFAFHSDTQMHTSLLNKSITELTFFDVNIAPTKQQTFTLYAIPKNTRPGDYYGLLEIITLAS